MPNTHLCRVEFLDYNILIFVFSQYDPGVRLSSESVNTDGSKFALSYRPFLTIVNQLSARLTFKWGDKISTFPNFESTDSFSAWAAISFKSTFFSARISAVSWETASSDAWMVARWSAERFWWIFSEVIVCSSLNTERSAWIWTIADICQVED